MSLMNLKKAELVERVEALEAEVAGLMAEKRTLEAEVNTLSTELAALKAPRVRRTDRLSFADFCVDNPQLPVLLEAGESGGARKHCPACTAIRPTNRFGVCSTCAPAQYAAFNKKAA